MHDIRLYRLQAGSKITLTTTWSASGLFTGSGSLRALHKYFSTNNIVLKKRV